MSISEAFRQAVLNGTVTSQISITVFEDGQQERETITNRHITSESMKLSQSVCDEAGIRFGGCVASTFEIDVSSKFSDLTGRYITVNVTQTATMPLYPGAAVFPGADVFPGGAVYTQTSPIFSGDIQSCKLGKNRLTRHLVAYDRFYGRGLRSCKELYDRLFSNGATVTLGQLRAAIISEFGFTEAQSVTLPADGFVIHKMETDELNVSEALRMIGEMSGVFIRLNGHGDIEYVSIGGTSAAEQYDFYIDADAEDYAVTGFDSVDTHSIGMYDMFADSPQDKPYDLDNPLVLAGYVSPAAVGDQFRDAFYAVRDAVRPNYTIAYTPFDLKAQARLWVQPGDRVQFNIRWYSLEVDPETGAETATAHTMTVNSVVLSRRITGIQAMTDELEAR